jgi:small ligand-binding sensory domain FIST
VSLRSHAAALSEHPLATHAVGELVGHVLDELQGEPDVAVLFVGGPSVGAVEDIAGAVRELLRPAVLVGATAAGVVGGPREVEDGPAVSLWAARTGPVTPLRLTTPVVDGEVVVVGLPPRGVAATERHAVVLADPFSFLADVVVAAAADLTPELRMVGGLASAGAGPGGDRLVLDDAVHHDGAVGFLLPAGCRVDTVVSQGCRPIGRPLVVTRAAGNLLVELAGRPAAHRLAELLESLGPEERTAAAAGLHIGLVIDERKAEFGAGDFLVRAVLGVDRPSGGVLVGQGVEVGTTVQFQLRDPASATEDLERMLAGRSAASALLFTCTGRGHRLFGVADHDASRVHERTGSGATAGMFCAGEIGPVAGRTFVHGYTASALLLH